MDEDIYYEHPVFCHRCGGEYYADLHYMCPSCEKEEKEKEEALEKFGYNPFD